ncbi:MAG: tetratricopeptide repeat protein [bacterium]
MFKFYFTAFLIAIFAIFNVHAQSQYNQEEIQKATNYYVNKIRSDPENLDLHRELIKSYKEKGLIVIPISIYEDSAKKHPENPIVNYVLGYAYLFEGSSSALQKAEKCFRSAIMTKPKFADAIAGLGDYYFKIGQEESAIAKWNEAINVNEKFIPAYLSLADLYRSKRQYLKAIEIYEQLIDSKPKSLGDIYYEIGNTYIEMHDLKNAESALLQAKRYSPKNGMIYYKLGQIYAKQGLRDKAVELYRQGRKYDPDNSKVAYELANIFIDTNDTRYALLSIERGLSADKVDQAYTKEFLKMVDKGIPQAVEYLSNLANSKYSNNFYLLFFLGKIYAKLNNEKLAIDYFERAKSILPTNPDVYYQLGILYEKQTPKEKQNLMEVSESKSAKEQYRKAVDLGAESAELLFKVAKGYLDEGQEAKFIEVASKALSIDPNRVDIHLELAKIFQKRALIYKNDGQNEESEKALAEAIKHYEQVTSLQPNAQRWYNLGLLYELYGGSKAIKAVRAYEQAIQLDPNFALAYYQLGTFRLNYKVGPAKVLVYKPETAIEELKKAIELDPKLADAHVSLGLAYYQMDMPELATAEFEKAVEIDPNNVRARILLTQDYANVDDYQKVIEHLSKAASVDINNFEVLKTYGAMLLKHGTESDIPKAREVLEKAVKLKPDDAEVNMNYGYTLYLGGMFSSAIEYLKKALEIQPNYPEAHYNIALAYSRIGEYNLAREHWEKVVKLSPGSQLADKANEFLEKFKK